MELPDRKVVIFLIFGGTSTRQLHHLPSQTHFPKDENVSVPASPGVHAIIADPEM